MGQHQNLNIRLSVEMVARIEARLEELKATYAGANFSRSDVIRMAIEAHIAEPEKPNRAKVVGAKG